MFQGLVYYRMPVGTAQGEVRPAVVTRVDSEKESVDVFVFTSPADGPKYQGGYTAGGVKEGTARDQVSANFEDFAPEAKPEANGHAREIAELKARLAALGG